MYGFIVEGFNDEEKMLQIMPDAKFAVTKGTRFNNRVRMDIEKLIAECKEVFILTDPDEEGDKIANMVLKEFPYLKRVFIDKEEAKCYRNNRLKIGVEHCTVDYLKQVLLENQIGFK